jgi:hypothetical protein
MQNKEYFDVVDKASYGFGPWDAEPDKAQWTDPDTGLPCLAVRHRTSGHWCGYVGVSSEHPRHGVSYDEMYDLNVHGGPTFSGPCDLSDDEREGICHVSDEGELDDVWWVGFDCAHGGDLSPGMIQYGSMFSSGTYRSLEYVKAECALLASQLAE